MGEATCHAVESEPELELVAQIGRNDPLDRLKESGAEVAVEFTTPDAVKDNIRYCLENGIHCVVGTTGLSVEDQSEIGDLAQHHETNVFIAPNFAVGAVLMMRFAAEAAHHFESVEIVERHHERKLDAPSGTALRTAAVMNEARGRPWSVAKPPKESVGGSRGGETGGVHIHSVRLPGSIAHQEVIFGSPGEVLTIRHDSLDRSSFMPGVLLAIKRVKSMRGLTIGLEHVLDLA